MFALSLVVAVLITDVGSSSDGGVTSFSSFDAVTTPWGPGRKSSGDVFRSAALALADGPLRWSWNGFSVALGGQYFARGEVRDNADFRTDFKDTSLGVEHRARITVRASAKERVGIVLELQDVRGWGSEPSTVGVTPNTALHQGFVDVHAAEWLDVRIGRQELSYGEDRLLGSLDWAMSARAFDGVFVRVIPARVVTIDALGMMLRPPSWLTDTAGQRFGNSGSYLTGLYSRLRVKTFGADVYALGTFDDPSTSASGPLRRNNRFTFGARSAVSIGALAAVAEGAFQTGKVTSSSALLAAGAFAGKVSWTFSGVWGAPYVAGEFSAASPTFSQLFPTGHVHLGFMDYVGWQNVIAGRATVGFRPWGAHVWLDVHQFRSWDGHAPWSSASGAAFIAADAARAVSTMGTEVDLSVTVPVLDSLAVSGNVSVFVPGPLGGVKGRDVSTWGFVMLRAQM